MSRRPAAFKRGATRKAISSAVGAVPSAMPASNSRALSPGARAEARALSPSAAMTRFSPVKGTRSAIVPRQATRRRDSVGSRTPARRDRLRDLESHAGGRQVLEGIGASRLPGIDHDGALGQLVGNEVVVGHDDLDARLSGAGDALDRRDAAVDRDDHAWPMLGEDLPHRVRLQAVAVLEAVRKEGDGVGSGAQESGAQLGHRRDAVHVVVSEDDDPPPLARRGEQHVRRLLEALHQKGVVEPGRVRREELGRGLGRFDTPRQEKARHDFGNARSPRQAIDPLPVGRGHPPLFRSAHGRPRAGETSSRGFRRLPRSRSAREPATSCSDARAVPRASGRLRR